MLEQSIGPLLTILDEQTEGKNYYPLVNAMLSNFHGDFNTGVAMFESFRQGVLDVREKEASHKGNSDNVPKQ